VTVSNEDREAAVKAVRACFIRRPGFDTPSEAVAALIAHGWGPKPKVYAESLIDFIGGGKDTAVECAVGLADFLRERGIEVTDD
jgi:hypothetical protein